MARAAALASNRPIEIGLPPLHPGQQKVYDSKARFKVVCCGRRWGKTHLGVLLCIIAAARGGRAWWIGPSYPVANIGWKLLKAMTAPIPGVTTNEVEKLITFPNGGSVQVKSADRPDSLRGESLDLVVFDEVADIKQEAWYEAIRPALADRRGCALFIGTPRGQSNWFYDLFVAAQNDTTGKWEAFQSPTITNTTIPGIIEEVAEARQNMHPVIATQEFDAEFVTTGGTVYRDSWQKWYKIAGDSQHMYQSSSGLVLEHDDTLYEAVGLSKCIRFATVDPAVSEKTTADYTVMSAWALTPKRNLCLLDFERGRMEGPDMVPAMQRLRALWKLSYIGFEKVGFQMNIIQAARRKGLPIRKLTPDGDKIARNYLAAAHMQGGKIWWRRNISDINVFTGEVMSFPQAAHDDCPDTLCYAAEQIESAVLGSQLASW